MTASAIPALDELPLENLKLLRAATFKKERTVVGPASTASGTKVKPIEPPRKAFVPTKGKALEQSSAMRSRALVSATTILSNF